MTGDVRRAPGEVPSDEQHDTDVWRAIWRRVSFERAEMIVEDALTAAQQTTDVPDDA